MMIGDVHHIGYLVKDIDKSVNAFRSLGYEIETDMYYDTERMSHFCFLKKSDVRVELVKPAKDSDIFPLLKTYNNSIYHICYEVMDIDSAISVLKQQGYLLFRDKQTAPAISETAVVVFLMHTRIGIIELLQGK